mmetsp:Transcript_104780/g.266109  ORF Transcript_104780/g.266109 Transcript_104780/m.266109 type:complete len:210 (+) Transcript_104780:181-810(+)
MELALRVVSVREVQVPSLQTVDLQLDECGQLHVKRRLDEHGRPERQQRRPEPSPPHPALASAEPSLEGIVRQAIEAVVEVVHRSHEGQNNQKRQLPVRVRLRHDAAPIGTGRRGVEGVRVEAEGLQRIDVDGIVVLSMQVAVGPQQQKIQGQTAGERRHPLADPRSVVRGVDPILRRVQQHFELLSGFRSQILVARQLIRLRRRIEDCV